MRIKKYVEKIMISLTKEQRENLAKASLKTLIPMGVIAREGIIERVNKILKETK